MCFQRWKFLSGQILGIVWEVLRRLFHFLLTSLRKLSSNYFASLTPAFQCKWLFSRIMSDLFWSHCLSLSGKKWTIFQSTPMYIICVMLCFFWGEIALFLFYCVFVSLCFLCLCAGLKWLFSDFSCCVSLSPFFLSNFHANLVFKSDR